MKNKKHEIWDLSDARDKQKESQLWRGTRGNRVPNTLKLIRRNICQRSLLSAQSNREVRVARSSIGRGNTNREWQPIYFASWEKFATRKYRSDCWQANFGRICRGPYIFVLSSPFIAASRSSRLTFHCGKQLPHSCAFYYFTNYCSPRVPNAVVPLRSDFCHETTAIVDWCPATIQDLKVQH